MNDIKIPHWHCVCPCGIILIIEFDFLISFSNHGEP